VAYDAASGQLVLFGGENEEGDLLGDTWAWNGTTWSEVSTTGPSARAGAQMAYDAESGQLVLFGGQGTTDSLNDTWTWNGTTSTWTLIDLTTSPPARYYGSMTYDPAVSRLVLFGGVGSSGDLADTWTWNGANWTNVTPVSPTASPPARDTATMAYDALIGEFVLFGGENADGELLDDTWAWDGGAWDGGAWDEVSNAGPPREAASMDYDPTIGQVVLFGGEDIYSELLADTWTWNGSFWIEASPAPSPPARGWASMSYDTGTGQLVLFGGEGDAGDLNDTWIFHLPVTPLVRVTNNSGVVRGSTLTFTATVAGPTGGATPTGTLTWAVTPPGGGSVACSSSTGPTGSSNVATYTCSIAGAVAGTYSATASYAGDPNYNAASGSDTSAVVSTPPIIQIAPTSGTTTTTGSSEFTEELATTGQSGAVSFVTTSVACGVHVSSSGAVSTGGTLPAGNCTVSGTDSDAGRGHRQLDL
jgi:hypothetical protein